MRWREISAVAVLGAVGYGALELLWRGRTHWTMLVLGGLCFLLVYELSGLDVLTLRKKCILGTAFITTLEWLTGLLVNCRLNWKVWDYSQQPLNLGGQICALYTLLWFLLCFPLISLCIRMRNDQILERLCSRSVFKAARNIFNVERETNSHDQSHRFGIRRQTNLRDNNQSITDIAGEQCRTWSDNLGEDGTADGTLP